MRQQQQAQGRNGNATSCGCGQSRAAKKRAKQKQKQKQKQQTATTADVAEEESKSNGNINSDARSSRTRTVRSKDNCVGVGKNSQASSIQVQRHGHNSRDKHHNLDTHDSHSTKANTRSNQKQHHISKDSEEQQSFANCVPLEADTADTTNTKQKKKTRGRTAAIDHLSDNNIKKKKKLDNNYDNNKNSDGSTKNFTSISDILKIKLHCNNNENNNNNTMLTAKDQSRMILQSLLYPSGITVQEFYSLYWEKQPLHISSGSCSRTLLTKTGSNDEKKKKENSNNNNSNCISENESNSTSSMDRTRFDGIFSISEFKAMIKQNTLQYTFDLNVTKCDDTNCNEHTTTAAAANNDCSARRVNYDQNDVAENYNDDDEQQQQKQQQQYQQSRKSSNKRDETKTKVVDEIIATSAIATNNERIMMIDNNKSSNNRIPEIINPSIVWNRFTKDKCTIRLLCPQKYSNTLHSLLSTLENEFGCMVGCNAYLTPGYSSQGFAPHYDDIEAFILQLEGKKCWKVYQPICGREVLPRYSSDDFRMIPKKTEQTYGTNSDGDHHGKFGVPKVYSKLNKNHSTDNRRPVEDNPVLDITLQPGDVLYMPRGWIHQARTPDQNNEHSLHLTISCMQNWSWADYMELLIPEALALAIKSETSTKLREGLPCNFLSYMGTIHEDSAGHNNDVEEKAIEGLKQAEKTVFDGGQVNGGVSESMISQELVMRRREFKEVAKKCISRVCREVSD